MELLSLLLVIWCVYVSEALWWTTSSSLILTGTRLGDFRARLGPSLPVREGRGFFASPLLPPFRYSFECELERVADQGRSRASRASVERRVAQALAAATRLRSLGQGLFLYLFVVVPLAIGSLGLIRTWAPLLAILVVWLIAIVYTYRQSWQKVNHGKPSGWRGDAALMILSPLGASRAADRLTRKALHGLSPMRVVSVATTAEEFCRIARLVYFDEETPWHSVAKRDIDEILESDRLEDMFVATPVREPGMQGFCRRCHGQVMRDSGTCPDCVVVSITPFDATDHTDPVSHGIHGIHGSGL